MAAAPAGILFGAPLDDAATPPAAPRVIVATGRCVGEGADVMIYDYVDDGVPVLARMHQKRLAGYRAMGYEVASGALTSDDSQPR